MKKLINVLIVATIALLCSCSNVGHRGSTQYAFQIGDSLTFTNAMSGLDNNLEEALFPYEDKPGRTENAVLFNAKYYYSNGDVYSYTFDEIIAQMMSHDCRPADLKEIIFFWEEHPRMAENILFFGDRTKRVSWPRFDFPVAEFNGNTLKMYDGYSELDKFLAIKERNQ